MKIIQSTEGPVPMHSSLTILPQTLDQYSLLVWKVLYTTVELALSAELDSVFCSDHNFTIDNSIVHFLRKPDITAVTKSGNDCSQFNVFQTEY